VAAEADKVEKSSAVNAAEKAMSVIEPSKAVVFEAAVNVSSCKPDIDVSENRDIEIR
jgi:hypothetical protein